MCHDHDSRPPAPPRSGDVAERGTLSLTARDGNRFSAAYAAPASPPQAGVVVLPDIRGLHPYYVALAERFAEAGLAAVAIDYFGRTAGAGGGRPRRGDVRWEAPPPPTTPARGGSLTPGRRAYPRRPAPPARPGTTPGLCL